MNLTELLATLPARGIRLSADGDRLNVRAPKGALTPELQGDLGRYKAEILALLRRKEPASALTIRPDPARRNEPFPLTDIQRAYQLGRSGGFDLSMPCQVVFEVEVSDLDPKRLKAAWRRVVERHDMLRAVVLPDGTQQVLRELPPWSTDIIDLTHLRGEEVEPELERMRHELLTRALPSDRWPLFELRFIYLPSGPPRFQIRIELTTIDARSVQLIQQEWVSYVRDPSLVRPQPSLTFRDFVMAEVEAEESEGWKRSREYWMQRLPELAPAPELPLATNPSTLARPTFRRMVGTLDVARLARLRSRAQQEGLTDAAVIATAWADLLATFSRTRPFSINVTFFNRPAVHPEIFEVVGDFTATLLVTVDLGGETFLARARAMQARLTADLEHARFNGVRVLRELNRQRGGTLSAAMPIVLTMLLGARTSMRMDIPETWRICWGGSQTPQVWLDHQIYEDDDGLHAQWDHIAELFPPGMIDAMMEVWSRQLRRLADDPGAWTERAQDLLPSGDARLIAEVNATVEEVELPLLHAPIWAHVQANPDRAAAIHDGATLSYGQLWGRASSLARALMEHGVRREEPIAVVLEKGPDQIVAVLGVLLAGAAYLPVSPDLPPARRKALCVSAGVRVAVTGDGAAGEGIDSIAIREVREGAPLEPSPSRGAGDELAYIIFTSGSTGQPKGVMIEHASAANTIRDVNGRFGIGPGDRVLAVSSLSFDLSVWDIFGILGAGGAVVYPEEERDPAAWLDAIERHGVTVWSSVPQLMDMLVDAAKSRGRRLPLRLVLMSGDWIPVDLPGRIRALTDSARIISMGGATEASIWSVLYEIGEVDPAWTSIPYGRAMVNQTMTVRDEALRLRPVGVPGDLYIGGVGLARGYAGDPEKTAERFVTDPRTSERLYRTGDLARLLPDGNLEFLGREDSQVKIRGHRVELGEIEATLQQCPGVDGAVVQAVGDPKGNRRLVAWVVGQNQLDRAVLDPIALRRRLAALLPDYMVPSAIYPLLSLPLTPTGKVDRKRLTAPDAADDEGSRTAPSNEVEVAITRLWAEVLESRTPSVHDSFFTLGGDSLLASRLLARIRETTGAEIPLRAFFEGPTVASLARHAAARRLDPSPEPSPEIVPSPERRFEPFPLTPLQQAYWVGRSAGFEIGNVAGHVYTEVESADLDLERLERAWNRLIARHDMLRATIGSDGLQRVAPEVPWYRIEVEGDPIALRQRMSHQVMPTDRWPLFEIKATRPNGRCRVHISLDTILGDAWAFRVLFGELERTYRDPDLALPPLELGFRDCVLALERLRNSERYQQDLAWWKERLAALPPPPELPRRREASEIARPVFERRFLRLSPAHFRRLGASAAERSLTPTAVLAAAYAEVLSRFCGGDAFTLNVPTFNRPALHPQINAVFGDFASFSLLAVDALDDRAFHARARALQERIGELVDHGLVHGVELLRELGRSKSDLSRNAFPVVFTSVLSLDALGRSIEGPEVLGERVYSITQTPQVWMDFQVFETAFGLTGQWDTVDELFPPGMAQGMLCMLEGILGRLVSDPDAWERPLGDCVPEEQKARRGPSWTMPVPARLPHAALDAEAARRPDEPAVIASDRALSFRELDTLAWRLSHALREGGVKADDPVPVVLEKGYRQAVAVLGVLRAGGAYMPVDPAVPPARLAEILSHGRGPTLTSASLDARLSWPAGSNRILLEDGALSMEKSEPFAAPQGPDHLAYVLFTSGSTGRPKGAMIEGRGVTNALLATLEAFQIGPADRALGVTALHHDMSVFDLLGVLGAGGTLVLPTPAGVRDPAELARLLVTHRITLWNSVPAFLEMLVEYAESGHPLELPDLRLAFVGGDWIPLTLPERLRRIAPRCRLVSVGGPTETTLWNIWHDVERVEPEWTSIPYGRPIPNTDVRIVGPHGLDCADGVVGEMVCSGVGVARGYLGLPDDPRFTRAQRSYRTGDLGRFRPDGTIEFVGRADHQLKVLGQRIEAGEVESALLAHPAVRAAVVGVAPERQSLVAWVVGDAPADEALRAFVAERLPPHMIPARFVHLKALPLTPNGKVDRRALTVPEKPTALALIPLEGPLAQVIGLVEEVLGISGIRGDSNLIALGANSMDLVRLANRMEQAFGVRPPATELFRDPTVMNLARTVAPNRSPEVSDDRAPSALVEQLRGYRLLSDPTERQSFRDAQRGVRPLDGAPMLPLPGPEIDAGLRAHYAARRTQRQFELKPVPREAFGRLFACLRQLPEPTGPRYLYPSGGGLYPVQVYVHARTGRVEGVDAGTYYYHPVHHGLVSLRLGVEIDRGAHVPFINQPVYDESAFSIFFVCDLEAIGPMYGTDSIHIATLEAGILGQLLDTEARAVGLGLCHIGRLTFDAIRPLFALSPSHVLIHSMLGGVPGGAANPAGADEAARASRLLSRIKQLSPEERRTLLAAQKLGQGQS